MSATVMALIFFIFLLLNCFRSWLGVFAFRHATAVVGGMFSLFQRGIVMLYHGVLGLVSRRAEYRCDRYSCSLGYGTQLMHFLSIADPSSQRQLTLAEALYRSHPPTEKRIARVERLLSRDNHIMK